MTTIVAEITRARWMDAPHNRYGRCASCGRTRDEDDRPLLLAGLNGDSMVCVDCFDQEHGGKHPNYRRRSRREAAA